MSATLSGEALADLLAKVAAAEHITGLARKDSDCLVDAERRVRVYVNEDKGEPSDSDALLDHIAAANPATVAELVREVLAARKAKAAYEEAVRHMQDTANHMRRGRHAAEEALARAVASLHDVSCCTFHAKNPGDALPCPPG